MLKKILYVNFTIILIVFCIIEILSFQAYKNRYKDLIEAQATNCPDVEQCKKELSVRYTKARKFNYSERIKPCLSRVYNGTKKGGIVTIGCSYAYGILLDESQTFAYKLNKLTGRTTYNRGVSGSGPQMVYRQISDNNFKNEVPEAEYFIYIFLHNHLERQFQKLLCFYLSDLELNYNLKNGELKEDKKFFPFLYRLFTVKNFLEYQEKQQFYSEFRKDYPLFYKTMEESVKAMKKNYPDAKFVLIEIPDANMCRKDYKKGESELTSEQITKLESFGIIYINAEELVGHQLRDTEKYRMPDKDHPNERVWDEIVPALVKKLNL